MCDKMYSRLFFTPPLYAGILQAKRDFRYVSGTLHNFQAGHVGSIPIARFSFLLWAERKAKYKKGKNFFSDFIELGL